MQAAAVHSLRPAPVLPPGTTPSQTALPGCAPALPRPACSGWLRTLAGLLMACVLTGCSGLPSQPQRPDSHALAQPLSTPLGQQIERRRQQAGARHASGFSLLGGAEQAYSSRLALVLAARHTLDLQYYAIHADGSSERLLRAVAEAAARGVRVRILLDDFHSAGENAQVMRLAFVPGIQMRMFNPVTGPRGSTVLRALSALTDFDRVQQRMHNKLFIADNTIGIAGGRNLGDAYFDALDSDNFIDLDVMAAGAVVQQLSRSFDRYWNDARAYPVQSLVSLKELQQLQRLHPPEGDAALPPQPGRPRTRPARETPPMDLAQVDWVWAPSVVLVDEPTKIQLPAGEEASEDAPASGSAAHTEMLPDRGAPVRPAHARAAPAPQAPAASASGQGLLRTLVQPLAATESVVDGLLAMIDQARQELWIVSPYFVPGPDMKSAFARARQRGVRVRVLTNSLASNDAPVAHAGYAHHRPELLSMGIELYELRSVREGGAPGEPDTVRSAARRLSGSTGSSRAMLHSKLVVMDGRLTALGSMNLDLRSQLHNTEIALLVASARLARQAIANIEGSLARSAWRVEQTREGLVWRAPPETDLQDQTTEPDASLPLRWLLRLIGPLAPDHLL